MKIQLKELDKNLKLLITSYLLTVTIGFSIGIYFVNHTTDLTPAGAVERFNGSQTGDEFDIPDKYPKPLSEMLTTTHNHVLGFSFIFGSIALIFYFNSILNGFLKKILIIEPFVSIIISFGSIWLMRFVHPDFVYLIIVSAILMYLSFYTMVGFSLFDIWKRN